MIIVGGLTAVLTPAPGAEPPGEARAAHFRWMTPAVHRHGAAPLALGLRNRFVPGTFPRE